MQTTLEKNVSHTRHLATPLAVTCLGLFCYPQVLLNETRDIAKGRLQVMVADALVQPLHLHPQRGTLNLKPQNSRARRKLRTMWCPLARTLEWAPLVPRPPRKAMDPIFSWEKVFGFHYGAPAHTTLSCSKPPSSILTKNNEVEARGDGAVGGGPMGR